VPESADRKRLIIVCRFCTLTGRGMRRRPFARCAPQLRLKLSHPRRQTNCWSGKRL